MSKHPDDKSALDLAAGSAVLFEAALQYALDRDQCTRAHISALRKEGDSLRHGRDYYRTSAVVLARKIREWDGEIMRLRDRLSQLQHTVSVLSSPNASGETRRGE